MKSKKAVPTKTVLQLPAVATEVLEAGEIPTEVGALNKIKFYYYTVLSTISVADPDHYVFGPPDPDPLVRGTDPAPFIIKQK